MCTYANLVALHWRLGYKVFLPERMHSRYYFVLLDTHQVLLVLNVHHVLLVLDAQQVLLVLDWLNVQLDHQLISTIRL